MSVTEVGHNVDIYHHFNAKKISCKCTDVVISKKQLNNVFTSVYKIQWYFDRKDMLNFNGRLASRDLANLGIQ